MIEKKCKQNVIKSTLFLLIALILVLLDKLKDYHITGIQFFSILFILYLPIILYKVIKYDACEGFFIALNILIYSLFFYLSVFYIFVPACTLINIEGIITFFIMIVVFLIASAIGALITLFVPALFANTENKIVLTFVLGIEIALAIASFLILFSFSRTLLSWGFSVEYQNVIIQNSPKFMISLMHFLFK